MLLLGIGIGTPGCIDNDGTVIDEPLTATDVLYNGYILLSPDKANLWMGGAWGDANNRINYCPVSRLP